MSNALSKNSFALAGAYAVNLAAALYFSKSITVLHSAYLLAAALALLGLAIGAGFSMAGGKGEGGSAAKLVVALIFAAVHGAVAYALARYAFNLDWQTALAYPVGAAVAWIVFALLSCRYPQSLNALLAAAFLAGGLVIALRLGCVWAGLVYGLALLNSCLPGGKWLGRESAETEVWERALFFASLLAVGRAAIQYYLLQSNYASLGVVITHPYTYVALFAGVFLPALYWVSQRDRFCNPALALVLLGLVLPLALGVFVHVRPMAGFLLGLVTASFLLGILFTGTYGMGLLSYLGMAGATVGLPLFAKLSNLSRVARLEILGVIAVVLFLVLAFLIPRGEASRPPHEKEA
ncbi:MAG: hypothetical protein IT572_07995 [Deltaproteobacteria bacterium]|nr:hypothetical protein [Deltaproteobacteria bacterium]